MASHSICGGTVVMEPSLDGKIIETAADGTTHQWGHVTAWDALCADGVAQRGNYQHGWTQILGSCYADFVAGAAASGS